jgi:hypothetical protein
MDQTHVTFRWKDRKADTWRTERLEGSAFLRRSLQHVLPRGFHKVRYYGLWHPSKRTQSSRAWFLLTLEALAHTKEPPKLADLLQTMGQLTEGTDQPGRGVMEENTAAPHCPHCGSHHTRFLGAWPRFRVPRPTTLLRALFGRVLERTRTRPFSCCALREKYPACSAASVGSVVFRRLILARGPPNCLSSAAKRFVQETFHIGVPMRKVLSLFF